MTKRCIAVKPNKVRVSKKVDPKNVTSELYMAVQKACKSVEVSEKDKYSNIIPVVCIRTTYSNEVFIPSNTGKPHKEYGIAFEHTEKDLYSLCILSCKQAFLELFKEGEVPEDVLMHSLAYPIGMTYHDGTYYLLSHLVVDETFIDTGLVYDDYCLVSINDWKDDEPMSELESALASKLLIVSEKPKEEE